MDYCQYHFTVEEVTMKSKNYMDFENHKAKHKIFVTKMKELKNEHSKGNPSTLTHTIQYLNLWLIDHIMIEDRKYVPYVR
jgi:hemerythrin